MTLDDDTPDTDDEWRFEEFSTPLATQGGGGLLQEILDEVTAMSAGIKADRVALADALTHSFAKLEVELEVLREQVTSLRADVDASGASTTNAVGEMLKAASAETDVDLPAVIERAVAAQGEANVAATVEAILASIGPQLTALRKAVPTADTARIAVEVTRLRHSLIGPDTR
jgi:hypothetical protein